MERFYVSMVRGKQYRLLLGPFETHDEALALVDEGRRRAIALNERHWWDAFGTVKITAESPPDAIFSVDT